MPSKQEGFHKVHDNLFNMQWNAQIHQGEVIQLAKESFVVRQIASTLLSASISQIWSPGRRRRRNHLGSPSRRTDRYAALAENSWADAGYCQGRFETLGFFLWIIIGLHGKFESKLKKYIQSIHVKKLCNNKCRSECILRKKWTDLSRSDKL